MFFDKLMPHNIMGYFFNFNSKKRMHNGNLVNISRYIKIPTVALLSRTASQDYIDIILYTLTYIFLTGFRIPFL